MHHYENLSISQKKYLLTRILTESGFFQISEISLEIRVALLKSMKENSFQNWFKIFMSGENDFEEKLQKYFKSRKSTLTVLTQKIYQNRLKIEEYIDEYQANKSFNLEDELNLLEN